MWTIVTGAMPELLEVAGHAFRVLTTAGFFLAASARDEEFEGYAGGVMGRQPPAQQRRKRCRTNWGRNAGSQVNFGIIVSLDLENASLLCRGEHRLQVIHEQDAFGP